MMNDTWIPSEFGEIEGFYINQKLIWIPGINVMNSGGANEEITSMLYSNNEWIVDGVASESLIYPGSTRDFDHDVVTFTLRIRRYFLSYVITIIVPSFALTNLCVLGMFWSKFDQADYLAKIAGQDIPKTNELPSLSVYIMVNLLLLTIAISMVIILSKACHSPKFKMCRSYKRLVRL
ncbi:unnamed protein product [Cylicocyclus nassatus]|uniref:Neurotransmitter-gated ion-channel ligand-binding domain-containing protein n=1 Tax=Cylicocyclus nassatus TaxID=53992 RepID=A0AA36GNC1_CYLNA|nr:unnamed protein product [Cylicocyclus nassatus]